MIKRKKIRGQQRFAARPKLSQLFTARSRADRARGNDAIRRAHLEQGYSLSEIGRAVKLHYSTISRIVNSQEGDGAQNKAGSHILADTIREGLINSKFQTSISEIPSVYCDGLLKLGINQTFLRYIGRPLLEIPRRVTMGVACTYQVQDAREATLAAVFEQHSELARQVVNEPMQRR